MFVDNFHAVTYPEQSLYASIAHKMEGNGATSDIELLIKHTKIGIINSEVKALLSIMQDKLRNSSTIRRHECKYVFVRAVLEHMPSIEIDRLPTYSGSINTKQPEFHSFIAELSLLEFGEIISNRVINETIQMLTRPAANDPFA